MLVAVGIKVVGLGQAVDVDGQVPNNLDVLPERVEAKPGVVAEEEEEPTIVALAHTRVEPRAMMVEARDAAVADDAVLAASGARHHAGAAHARLCARGPAKREVSTRRDLRASHNGKVRAGLTVEDIVKRHAREAVQVASVDDTGVAEGGEREDQHAADHCRVRRGPVPVRKPCILRPSNKRQRVQSVEDKAATHERNVKELQQWIGSPATGVLQLVAKCGTTLPKAQPKDGPKAVAACELVVQVADEARGGGTKRAHVEQEAGHQNPHAVNGEREAHMARHADH